MKLKKKTKKALVIILVLLFILLGVLVFLHFYGGKDKVKEVKIVNQIEKYGYKLKDTKTSKYKKMFEELKKILNEKEVDEEKYVSKISEMFIYDFYSLNDKTAKTDIGGVDFVYSGVLQNFLLNAEDTYYKYVENNIYGNRNQSLPTVDKIEVKEVKQEAFAYGDKTDDKAYKVSVEWEYTDTEFSKYQTSATLVFIHDENKLCLVELQ